MTMPLQRVVIVEDDQLFRLALRAFLDDDGRLTVVGEAGTGLEALPVLERLHPDAVLIDFDMPVMDGLTTSIAIEERWPQLRIVMLTGSTLDTQKRAQIAAHVPIVLPKDHFEPQSLCDALMGQLLH
jgi:DNA-binding NarL/FixJ family response regulator